MIAAVIFDMDGVLVDSEEHFHGEGQPLLAELKPGMSPAERRALVGKNIDDIYDELTRGIPAGKVPMARAEYRAQFDLLARAVYRERAALMPRARETLELLRAKGYRIGLASSSPKEWIDLFLHRWDLCELFDVALSVYEIEGRAKPDPAVYLAAAERLGLAPEECVGVEDSLSGIRSVKAAGMWCVAFRREHELADATIAELAEVPAVLRRFDGRSI